jgi:uncharacterized RDD family membrane protein YckC
MHYEAPPPRAITDRNSRDSGPLAGPPVEWRTRAYSFLIDLAPVLLIYIIGGIFTLLFSNVSATLGNLATILTRVVAIGFVVWDLAFLQGRTGQCFGKSLIGTRCVSRSTGQPTGTRGQLIRLGSHFADLFSVIGWFLPLWDSKRQTFADKIAGTVVVPGPKKSFREALLSLKP